MQVFRSNEVPASAVRAEGAKSARIRELITAAQGAPNFAMRLFEVEPGGHTPLHAHTWEHEVFITEGQGEVRGAQATPIKQGDAVLVPGGEEHQFANTGGGVLKFICCIPVEQPCCR